MKVKKNWQMIFLFIILTILSISFSSFASKESAAAYGLHTKNINVGGISRKYAIYIPKKLGGTPLPLIFELHGGGVHIEDMTGKSGYTTPYALWMKLADKDKFIVVYPEGLSGAYGKPTWNDCRGDCIVNSNADDVSFINALIDKISERYNIDRKRIYVSGTSNGGFMALRLAVELSNKIAAVAAISAAMPAKSSCKQPDKPISILFMNGTNDNHMPYNGGYIGNPPNSINGSVLSTKASVNLWVKIDKTNKIPIIHFFYDLDKSDGGVVERLEYKNGIKKTEVVLYKINGGGHSAPSIKEQYSALFEQYFNKQNHDIEMTKEIWKFFKDKKLH